MKCSLCGRESEESNYFEKHHLFPGKMRRTKVDRKEDTIWVDHQCGDQIHLLFDNRTLRDSLDSVEALREAMASFIKWVRSQPLEKHISMKKKKRKL